MSFLINKGPHRDRRIDPLDVGLFDEDLPGLGAEGFDLRLFDDLAAAQLLDLTVEVAHLPEKKRVGPGFEPRTSFENEVLRAKHDRSSLKKKKKRFCESEEGETS